MATLWIKVVLTGAAMQSTRFVSDVVNYVEEAHFNTEVAILNAGLREFPEIPPLARDAALFRIAGFRGRTLRLTRAEPGSLVLDLIALPVGYWVLEKVCGEAFKEAWRQTAFHENFRDFFLLRIGPREKLAAVQRAIQPESLRRIFDNQNFAYRYANEPLKAGMASESMAIESEVLDTTLTITMNYPQQFPLPPADDREIQGSEEK